eukprot:gene19671-biopygen5297
MWSISLLLRHILPAPKTLWLICTGKWHSFGGCYNIVPDRQANGMPVWESGKNWIYSGKSDKWCLTPDEEDISQEYNAIDSAEHDGRMPDMTAWDARVSVSSVASVPETLRLVSNTQNEFSDRFYCLVPGRRVNAMPMWECGRYRLYSNTNGKWMVADDERSIAIDAGGIESGEHGGNMPHAVTPRSSP